ncbi:hypothetical protein [Desulfobulbus elongatus]|uniref:hypothetical protein n=1 Tax=Desulfobulbus elongatus TaxID=53332 RepID=UPI0012FCCDD1|nr:hypothetical protein [Desulfobulbus elongatus]
MLKAKKNVNYRRGSRRAKCSHCKHYVSEYRITLDLLDGMYLGTGQRCAVIGLQPGRMYGITADHVCDRFVDRFTCKAGR